MQYDELKEQERYELERFAKDDRGSGFGLGLAGVALACSAALARIQPFEETCLPETDMRKAYIDQIPDNPNENTYTNQEASTSSDELDYSVNTDPDIEAELEELRQELNESK